MESDATWISHGPNAGELGGCCISATLCDWGRLAMFATSNGVLADGTEAEDLIIVVQGAWPQATGAALAGHRDGLFRAVGNVLK